MEEHQGWPSLLRAAEAAPEARLRFEVGGRVMARGLHVTEMRRAKVSAVDCGLGRRDWEEAQLQLLVMGRGSMRGGTLAGLLRRGVEALSLDPEVPLVVEAAPDGGAAERHRVAAVEGEGATLRVRLEPLRPSCRPMQTAGCCGPSSAACCG